MRKMIIILVGAQKRETEFVIIYALLVNEQISMMMLN